MGEDYVANALEKGKGDFMRPLQQFATVNTPFCLLSQPCCLIAMFIRGEKLLTQDAAGIGLGYDLDSSGVVVEG